MNYFVYTSHHFTPHGRYELNKLTSLPMCGFIAHLVEQRTGNAEVTGWIPLKPWLFSGFFFPIASIGKFTAMIILHFQYRISRKKKWRRDLTETRSLWEVKPPRTTGKSCLHQLKKRWRKVEEGKIYARFSYLRNNLIFSIFLKEERDWELMTSLSSELKNLGPWKKGENFLVFVRQYGRR